MKKEELGFSERFLIPALSSVESVKMVDARSAVLRALYVSSALDDGEKAEDACSVAGRMFKKTLLETERKVAHRLFSEGLLWEGEDVSALEVRNGLKRCFIPDKSALSSVMVPVRERLKKKSLSDEDMALIWLWREAGVIPFIFTPREVSLIEESSSLRAFPLWNLIFGKKLELGGEKRRVEVTPKSERNDGAFIEKIFLKGDDDEAIISLLEERGHCVEKESEGGVTMLNIDSTWYEVRKGARKMTRIPVEGVSLVPTAIRGEKSYEKF